MNKQILKLLAIAFCVLLTLTGVGLTAGPKTNSQEHPTYYPDLDAEVMDYTLSANKMEQQTEFDFYSITEQIEYLSFYPERKAALQSVVMEKEFYPEFLINPVGIGHTSRSFEPKALPLALGLPHNPIIIDGNDDFARQAKAERWSGSGKDKDPYIIEDLFIQNSDMSLISVSNTDCHFIIRNCELDGITNSWDSIHFSNVVNGAIEGSIISNGNSGIRFEFSDNNTIVGNSLYMNIFGVNFDSSMRNSITGNEVQGPNIAQPGISAEFGIVMWYSEENSIIDNTVYHYDSGIVVAEECRFNEVSDNTIFENQWEGIGLHYAEDDIITNNEVYGCNSGITLFEPSERIRIIGNYIHDVDMYGITVGASSDVLVEGNVCNLNGASGILIWKSSSNRVRSNLCYENVWDGIVISNGSSSNIVIENECVLNGAEGIFIGWGLFASNENFFARNNCTDNGGAGILIGYGDEYSQNNVIFDNNCSRNKNGIQLIRNSKSTTVNHNLCIENTDYGIVIGEDIASGHTYENRIVNNTCNYNSQGIFVQYTWQNTLRDNTCSNNEDSVYITGAGIFCTYAFDNTLDGNICDDNTQIGIGVRYSSYHSLVNNTCKSNPYGIYLYECDNIDVLDNACPATLFEGITLSDCDNINVLNNTCTAAQVLFWGINLTGGHDNIVSNNTCIGFNVGILILSSDLNTISENTCIDNIEGIVVSNGDYSKLFYNTCTLNENGIRIYSSDGCEVSENNLIDNTWGLAIVSSRTTQVGYNTFDNLHGIEVYATADTTSIYGNHFHCLLENIKIDSGADSTYVFFNLFESGFVYDDSVYSTFDRNYYYDYEGPDYDGDGFGDIPYEILGEGASIDYRPLVFYPTPVWLSPPSDVTLEYGQRLSILNLDLDVVGLSGPVIWSIDDTVHFAISDEGRIIDTMMLPIGEYPIEVQVENIYGIPLSATFTITVVESLSTQWSLELSGDFDYPDTEEVPIQIAAHLTFAATGNSISGAYIELRIYNPAGDLFLTVSMTEIESGIYVYRFPETIDYYVREGIWQKGIYLVVGDASVEAGSEVRAQGMLQYHIDPPGGAEANLPFSFAMMGFGGLAFLSSTFIGREFLVRRRNK